jgi:hypothetical protein
MSHLKAILFYSITFFLTRYFFGNYHVLSWSSRSLTRALQWHVKLQYFNMLFVISTWNFKTFFFIWRNNPQWARASSFTRFLDHTQRRTIVGRTPLDEWSAHRRDLYLTTHDNHNRLTSMPPVGFEPTIPARERQQTYALDGAATETGISKP